MDRNTIADLEKYKAAQKAFDARNKEYKEASRKLREDMGLNDLSIEVGSLEVKIRMKYNLMDKTMGDWDCKDSPLGVCFYETDDGAMDDCIFCHEPDERK